MSKSLGNTVLVSEMAKRWRPVELRYYLGAAHYRSAIEYSPDALDETAASYRGIENFLSRAREFVAGDFPEAKLADEFADAMDDDLAVPRALAVLHNRVRTGNAALTAQDRGEVASAAAEVSLMLDVLGLSLASPDTAATEQLTTTVDHLVRLALIQRQSARDRKDYAAGDAIRDSLADAGVVVEDTPNGPRWTLAEPRGK